MNFVFSRFLVQHILAGAQEYPDRSRHGVICGPDFQTGTVHWANDSDGASDIAGLLRQYPDALATLVTHPDTPPVPTAQEMNAPRPASQLLLVASLQTKGVLEMRAFDDNAGDSNGVPITLF